MKMFYHKVSFLIELIVSGFFILFYYILTFMPFNDLWEVMEKSFAEQITGSLCYMVPIVVTLSLITQWNYYGTLENLLRRGTFTIIVLVPLYIVWGDWQFTFWLSCVHLLSSVISFYEKAPITSKEDRRFSPRHPTEYLWGLSTSQIILISFFLLIIVGTTLLMLPISTLKDVPLIDHLFMVTSAACVTGLASVKLDEVYSYFGQMVILLCIQIGGLGIMTLSSSLTIFLGKSFAVKEKIILQDILDVRSIEGIVEVIIDIIKTTIVIEIIGAVILTGVFVHSGLSFGSAIYHGVFHSISAFCNAGFSPLPDGLLDYKTNVVLNFTITTLIILGGIGFWVIKDVRRNIVKYRNPKRVFQNLSLHSKVVLSTSMTLIILGTVVLFVCDFMGAISPYNLTEKILLSYFHSVSARTAGFNLFPLALLSSQSIFFLIILMFIGASPGSTGGGIKTTTFAIILQSIKTILTGKTSVEMYNRTVEETTVLKATALGITSLITVSLFTLLLLVFESDKNFLHLLFEAVSAFGTVGLSIGITPDLTNAGKLIIICLMYIGRVGPLTLVLGIGSKHSKESISYPKEKVIIG